jgi:hypothetical protein
VDAEEILVELGRKGDGPPVMALRAAWQNFDQVRERLMMVLGVAAEDPWILSQSEVWQLNYGFFVLAAKRHKPALAPLLGFLSWAEADAFEIVGDFLTEDAAEVIVALAVGDGDAVADATLRRSLQWFALDAMNRALGIMALRGEWPRTRYLAHMDRVLRELLLDHSAAPIPAWSAFAELAAWTHLPELATQLAGLYRTQRIDPDFVTEEELAKIFRDPQAPAKFLARHPEIIDPADRVARWGASWEGEGEKTPVRKWLRVGRNDPCHCGSGEKYKRCCGETI